MPFSLMDNIISMKRDGVDYYYLTDAMGSVYQVVDENGNVANAYDYNAWGEIREENETVTNPFLWQTKPWDEEIGLYYSRARYYEGKTGRFLGVDPVMSFAFGVGDSCLPRTDMGFIDARYVFAANNPVSLSDPTGLVVDCCAQYGNDVKDDCLEATALGAAALQLFVLSVCAGIGLIPGAQGAAAVCAVVGTIGTAGFGLYMGLIGCNKLGKAAEEACRKDPG